MLLHWHILQLFLRLLALPKLLPHEGLKQPSCQSIEEGRHPDVVSASLCSETTPHASE